MCQPHSNCALGVSVLLDEWVSVSSTERLWTQRSLGVDANLQNPVRRIIHTFDERGAYELLEQAVGNDVSGSEHSNARQEAKFSSVPPAHKATGP